jgi:hypothetical protein
MKYPTEYKYNILVERYSTRGNISEYSIGQADTIQGIIDKIRQDVTGRVDAYGYRHYVVVNQENGSIRAISKRA